MLCWEGLVTREGHDRGAWERMGMSLRPALLHVPLHFGRWPLSLIHISAGHPSLPPCPLSLGESREYRVGLH